MKAFECLTIWFTSDLTSHGLNDDDLLNEYWQGDHMLYQGVMLTGWYPAYGTMAAVELEYVSGNKEHVVGHWALGFGWKWLEPSDCELQVALVLAQ